jgi:broad specificity phosphatase PhoE
MTGRLIYICRHGETDWNAQGRIQGQRDIPINATGRKQADRNGRLLTNLLGQAENFDFVASPLNRTCETMERIRTQMGLSPSGYTTDARLMEVHFGDWQGFTMNEVDVREPGIVARRDASKWSFLPPGNDAESYDMLATRVTGWLESVEKPAICVTHGGVMRTLFKTIGGMDGDKAAMLDIPQDRVLELKESSLQWL